MKNKLFPLDQPVEYFRMVLVILVLALEITGPPKNCLEREGS
jgi:hypothetical protein